MKNGKLFLNWENPGVAIVTGASAGIGKDFARQLAAKGFNLILLARRKQKLEDLAEQLRLEFSIQVDVWVADLSKISELERVSAEIEKIEDLDILINNAGFGSRGKFHETDLEPRLTMMMVHNTAPVYLCRTAIPIMVKKNRGAIINVSSLATYLTFPESAMYIATKSFLNGFSEGLSLDLKDNGIRVQALCPGMTHTEFHSVGVYEDYDKSVIPKFLWMTSEETVRQSLKALEKNKVIFIPGRKNRFFKSVWQSKLLGRMIRNSSRKQRQ